VNKSTVIYTGILAGVLWLLAGCASKPTDTRADVVARFLIEADASQPAINVVLPVSGVAVRVRPKPVVTEFDIIQVAEADVDLGRCALFRLSASAGRDVYRLTAANINRRLVLVMNGQPIGVRVIDRPIEGGLLFIFLEVPDASLRQLVDDLNHTTRKIQLEAARKG
jgi:preprotein translocase subunit SecD